MIIPLFPCESNSVPGLRPRTRQIGTSTNDLVALLPLRPGPSYGTGGGLLNIAATNLAMLQVLLYHDRQPEGLPSPAMKRQLELKDDMGRTPLLTASRYYGSGASRPLTVLLLDNGAAVDVHDDYGATPLDHVASNRFMTDLIPRLVSLGAKMDINNDDYTHPKYKDRLPIPTGGPVLLQAAEAGRHDVLKILIGLGATVDIIYTRKFAGGKAITLTPLVAAVHKRELQCAEMLLESGASMESAFKCDPGLLDCCRRQQDVDMEKLLLRYGAKQWDCKTATTTARYIFCGKKVK